jgi:hypothetical protein
MSNSLERKMPQKLELGQQVASAMSTPIYNWEDNIHDRGDTAMGYKLPQWQRPFVWTTGQSIKFLESAWLGLNIGTYTFNRSYDLLIDGQQRLKSIENYLSDYFSVFGYHWSELSRPEQRGFEMSSFPSFITKSKDDAYLRSYYDTMNFSGTAHQESQRATK